VKLERTLAPGEWFQWNGVLGLAGLADGANGYARVRRVAGDAPFLAYGIVNDAATADGSFLPAFRSGGLAAARRVVVPVVLDVYGAAGSHFTTELTIVNDSPIATPVDLFYRPAPGFGTAPGVPFVTLMVPARGQRIVPDAIQMLRENGIQVPDPLAEGPQGGALAAEFRFVRSLDTPRTLVLARTSTPNPDAAVGGSFGLFQSAFAKGGGARRRAVVPGLTQNEVFAPTSRWCTSAAAPICRSCSGCSSRTWHGRRHGEPARGDAPAGRLVSVVARPRSGRRHDDAGRGRDHTPFRRRRVGCLRSAQRCPDVRRQHAPDDSRRPGMSDAKSPRAVNSRGLFPSHNNERVR
jgi:hypothetical protein